MQITSNGLQNNLSLGFNYHRDTVGIVLKTAEDFGGDKTLLGVVIPKFMVGYDFKSGDKFKEFSSKIDSKKFINDSSINSFGDSSVTVKNYILVRPFLTQNIEMPKYTVGDKVIVGVIDDDIKTLAFYPYSINRLGQRATDHYVASVPAKAKENVALTADNTYYIKLDSTDQVVEISTNADNGETAKQTLTFDSKEGIITLTDNKDREISMNTNDDKINVKTSGANITMTGDIIDMHGDVLNIKTDTSINLETDKITVKANTITSEGSDVTYDYDNFKQTSQTGEWDVDSEKHSGTATSFKSSTFHCTASVIGLNGTVIFPSFQIGAIPDPNTVPSPITGISGSGGSMSLETDPAGMPLVKYPALIACLTTIAAAADAYPSGAGAASQAVQSLSSNMKTTKIMAS